MSEHTDEYYKEQFRDYLDDIDCRDCPLHNHCDGNELDCVDRIIEHIQQQGREEAKS